MEVKIAKLSLILWQMQVWLVLDKNYEDEDRVTKNYHQENKGVYKAEILSRF
jgi:hypothetical protein